MTVNCTSICCHLIISGLCIVSICFLLLLIMNFNPWFFVPIFIPHACILGYFLIKYFKRFYFKSHNNHNNSFNHVSIASILIDAQIDEINLQSNHVNQQSIESTEPPPPYKIIEIDLPTYEMLNCELPSYKDVVKEENGSNQNNNSFANQHLRNQHEFCLI